MMMQLNIWGEPSIKEAEYLVYHDESVPNKQWLLIGLLFVPKKEAHILIEKLKYYRQRENYEGEIHFSELPKKFGGEFGAKARVARAWMKAYEDDLHEIAYFSALGVYRGSPAFEHKRFSRDFHAYNRFTAMALKAGIAWHLGSKGYERLNITFISDAKDRSTSPDPGFRDNFEEYIPYRAEVDSYLNRLEGKRYPEVFISYIKLLDSSEEDLIQLTDLLLGATQSALITASRRETKMELAEMVLRWQKDLRNLPWKQKYGLYRKFNIWLFPDEKGRPFNPTNYALESVLRNDQLSFLDQ